MDEMEAGADDYMGDLSKFVPPEASNPLKKILKGKPLSSQISRGKKPAAISWQEQRKIDRDRKLQEEDKQTLANCGSAIPSSNVGFKMLQRMGYKPGSALGREGDGRSEPVMLEIRRSRAGIGREDPEKEKEKKWSLLAEKKMRKEERMNAEFGSRQRLHWRSRRIVADFNKAKAAIMHLEKREILEPEKILEGEEAEDENAEAEEEEEIITEEDLQDILSKLRDEYMYCLYCGYQYETMDQLLANCPGPGEDDH